MMEIKERILQTSQELFYRYGIKSVTMDDIARELAVSKKTLYQFFEDKEQIVLTLCRQEIKSRQCEFEDISKTSKDPVHEIMLMMKHMGQMIAHINPHMFYDLQKYHNKAWKEFKLFKDKELFDTMVHNIKKGIEMGLYRNDIDPKIMARLRIEEFDLGINPNVFPADKYNMTKVQLSLLDHFLYGISTLKGHKLINKYKQITEED